MPRQVAIIGAGPAGLASAKAALESGLQPVVFEKAAGPGGLWNPASGGMWNTMKTNLSHYSCGFSDFPWPEGSDTFPTASAVHDYLAAYAQAHNLLPHIHFDTPVESLCKTADGWQVITSRGLEQFENVIIASGFFSHAHIPAIDNINGFQGQVLHSSAYKNAASFAGKSVLVVGNSFSGAEIASDLAGTAGKITNAVRTPVWVLPRYFETSEPGKKLPLDLFFFNRAASNRERSLSQSERNSLSRTFFAQACGNPGDTHPDLQPVMTDDAPVHLAVAPTYLEKVKGGAIQIHKSPIARFETDRVIFASGTSEKLDAVIFCTGYETNLAYLDSDSQNKIAFDPRDRLQPLPLYKSTVHPALPGLAFVGMYKGPYFATIEIQARWATGLFSGQRPYPSAATMEEGLERELAIRQLAPRPQYPHGDYVDFTDSLALEAGIKPAIADERDSLWTDPLIPQHYRLHGPNAAPDMAGAVMDGLRQRLAYGF